MPWHSTFPLGTVSVKQNESIGQDNTTYIETTMGNTIVGSNTSTTRDHFWDVGSDEDGRHRFIQSIGFTSNVIAPDDVYPVLGAGMETVLFPLSTNGEVQWFHKNQLSNSKIYQFIPNFITGAGAVSSSFTNLISVPANVYGEIFMWQTALGENTGQPGFFRSNGTTVEAWSYDIAAGTGRTINVRLANGSNASGLNIRTRSESGSNGNWNYRVTYRAI